MFLFILNAAFDALVPASVPIVEFRVAARVLGNWVVPDTMLSFGAVNATHVSIILNEAFDALVPTFVPYCRDSVWRHEYSATGASRHHFFHSARSRRRHACFFILNEVFDAISPGLRPYRRDSV